MAVTIRAVLFDADGVVQWPAPLFVERFEELGGPGFFNASLDLEKQALTGKVDFKPMLAGLLTEFGSTATADEIFEVWYDIDVLDDALALVDEVRGRGVITALATNQQSYRGGYMQRKLGLERHFDATFYSYEVGLAKPDPAYFVHCCAALGVTPGEALFIDDLMENVEGAREAGLHAEFKDRFLGADKLARILTGYGLIAS